MEIRFANNNLQRCYEDEVRAIRRWGQQIGHRYISRIDVLYAAQTLDDLYSFQSLHFHPLTGNRAGEWAITLHGPWRLILDDLDDNSVRVKEVSVHYGN